MKQNIICPCGGNFPVEIEEEFDLDVNPEHIENICSGTFLSFICPVCGKKHKPEFKIMVVWKSKNIRFEILPELDRGEFYRKKKDKSSVETIIGYPEMSERIAVIKDDLVPIIIETLKYYLLVKAEEEFPDRKINAWYYCKEPSVIEFHLDGIKSGEVAVMKVPMDVYEKTCEKYRKHPKNEIFTSLRINSYISVQNILRPDALK